MFNGNNFKKHLKEKELSWEFSIHNISIFIDLNKTKNKIKVTVTTTNILLQQ